MVVARRMGEVSSDDIALTFQSPIFLVRFLPSLISDFFPMACLFPMIALVVSVSCLPIAVRCSNILALGAISEQAGWTQQTLE